MKTILVSQNMGVGLSSYIEWTVDKCIFLMQVGMMLRGMGFDNTTSVYVAAGKIYKAEKYMAPLKQMFPLLETKDTLATLEELAAFEVSFSIISVLFEFVHFHLNVSLHIACEKRPYKVSTDHCL